jgi:predicted DNA-binding transcriptional regulator AlpA
MNYYSRADLRAKGLKVANQTLLRWEARIGFPKRVPFPTGQTVLWVASEIDEWLERIAANREHGVARPGLAKVSEIRRDGATWTNRRKKAQRESSQESRRNKT